MSSVTVIIVTWRRHEMLRRAIRSALDQTHRDLSILVVNDDPDDSHVAEIISDFDDALLDLFQPIQKRGAARNFNLMFDDRMQTPFVALLEDDNWWQPEFLAMMMSLLERHPEQKAGCANERIWRENPDGSWTDTGQDIWPNFGEAIHHFSLSGICGSAKLCDSAMMYRNPAYAPPLTPDDIPVDETEHFRERMFLDGMALHASPMVNYAETLKTAHGREETWGKYQSSLIGSVFIGART